MVLVLRTPSNRGQPVRSYSDNLLEKETKRTESPPRQLGSVAVLQMSYCSGSQHSSWCQFRKPPESDTREGEEEEEEEEKNAPSTHKSSCSFRCRQCGTLAA